MTTLVTEYTARADVSYETAYASACHYVEETRSVTVADVRHPRAAQLAVELAIYAASHADIESEPTTSALQALVGRQAMDVGLSLGIAALGDTSGAVARRLDASLAHPPFGASRWIVGPSTPEAFWAEVVKWLLAIVDRRASGVGRVPSMADELFNTIDTNLPSSSVEVGSTEVRFRGVP